jgi:hypothetical protein
MDDPVTEIAGVITSLTKGSPQEQQNALSTYFTPNASFVHPFCRVPALSKGDIPLLRNVDSQRLILAIYRWYRTLSPKIELTVDSVAFDQKSCILYVNIHQTFAVWFIPFYSAPVRLVTVLHLTQERPNPTQDNQVSYAAVVNGNDGEHSRYYIKSQQDLYQLNDCIQFLAPGLGPLMWNLWQLFSTFLSFVLSLLFTPLFFILNKDAKVSKKA